MTDQSKLCECCTCGYTWPRGQDGSHSCSSTMAVTIEVLKAENLRLAHQIASDLELYGKIEKENAELGKKYSELLYQVENKIPGQTRHETALDMLRSHRDIGGREVVSEEAG